MVKVGFIVEGATEKIIIESEKFNLWLKSNNIELVSPVIDAKGGGNLLPKNIAPMIELLKNNDAQHIAILTDQENEGSVQAVIDRIFNEDVDSISVAVKAIEAWFLADTQAMNTWLGKDDFYENEPENTADLPWSRLKQITSDLGIRGPGNKVIFTKKMVNKFSYEVENSATHDNCPSATLFLNNLIAKTSH